MEKFTKTTEIDISAMNEMEDETPKKSNVGNIIAIIVCLIASIFIWLYVMETDSSLVTKTYKDIDVKVEGTLEGYEIINSKVDVEIKATKSDLADLSKDEIRVVLEANDVKDELDQKVSVKVYIASEDKGEWIIANQKEITVQVVKK